MFSHEVFGEGFYEMPIEIKRLSGQGDILPVTISERLMGDGIEVGDEMCILGQFRSYNKMENGKSRLRLTVFVREILKEPVGDNPNSIVLCGYICKPPIYRKTPFNREISDILIAVNRSYNKSDYIPAIAWGRNARFVKNLAVGDKIALSGRIQSREYQKKLSDETTVTKTAYEVSVSKLAAFGDDEDFDVDEEFDLYSSPVRHEGSGDVFKAEPFTDEATGGKPNAKAETISAVGTNEVKDSVAADETKCKVVVDEIK